MEKKKGLGCQSLKRKEGKHERNQDLGYLGFKEVLKAIKRDVGQPKERKEIW